MSDISDWYRNIPKFTKYWLSATVGLSLLARMNIIPGGWLWLVPELVIKKFQVNTFYFIIQQF